MARFVNPFNKYFDNSGQVLLNGKMEFLLSGTEDQLDTFADVELTIANTNPVILDAAGNLPNTFLQATAYKVRLFDENDVQIDEKDPVGVEDAGAAFDQWDDNTIFALDDITTVSPNTFYRSLVSGNQNNEPASNPDKWEQVQFVPKWNTNVTYGQDDLAQGTDGIIYTSLIVSNLANDPTANPTEWGPSSLLGSNAGFTTTQDVFKALAGSSIATDTIAETTPAAGVTVDSVLLKDGNVVPANGKGVDFSATPDATGSTSELLDHYEEGAWTPNYWDDDLADEDATYAIQVGRYTRVGRVCHIQGKIEATSLGTLTTSDPAKIGNLPFTSSMVTDLESAISFGIGGGLSIVAGTTPSGRITQNTDYISIRIWDSTTGTSIVDLSNITDTGLLTFSASYEVA